MRIERVHFSDTNLNKLGMLSLHSRSTNDSSRSKMKSILAKAIRDELTPLQRHCLTECCLCGKKQKEVARELGLNASTVSRHISAAMKKLKNIASYYM